MTRQIGMFDEVRSPNGRLTAEELTSELRRFDWQGRPTTMETVSCGAGIAIPVLVNEFWTSRQRAASSLHEVSYRACFKPQLPAFFVDRLTRPGDVVYDPFMGRGTSVIEAALSGRAPRGCDVNPLSHVLTLPRLAPPTADDVAARLARLDLRWHATTPEDLLAFYHEQTLGEICALRAYLLEKIEEGTADSIDKWIQMVAVNRLTGHSPGFFSVYTLPPNQALTAESQRKINDERHQVPPRRDVPRLILKKTRQLLRDISADVRRALSAVRPEGRFLVGSCATEFWEPESVDLVVTSPPFLDVVNYAGDNWLRCWFCGIDASAVPIAMLKKVEDWRAFVGQVFMQIERLLKPNGYVAFEVGEVRSGKIRLEEVVLPCGIDAGLRPVAVIVNSQTFTKTANIWGVSNNSKGTNTNRIVLFQKRS
jgi:hypothetical protein